MKRREFIAGLGTAAAWSLAARAQQPGGTVGRAHSGQPTDRASGKGSLRARIWIANAP
jgi:hypothetical protein